MIVHFINILFSEIFSGTVDPCTLYLISFILDTSIGLLLIYVLIKLVLFVASKLDIQSLNFGYYGEPTAKIRYWLHQTVAYIVILLIQKTVIIVILQSYPRAWDQVRDLILYLMPNKNVEVAMVILIIPFLVNIWVFWLTDNFLTMSNNYRSKKILNFSSSSQAVAKKLASLKNCISTSTKLVSMYDVMFIGNKQKLQNEEDDNLVEINLKEINTESNQTV